MFWGEQENATADKQSFRADTGSRFEEKFLQAGRIFFFKFYELGGHLKWSTGQIPGMIPILMAGFYVDR